MINIPAIATFEFEFVHLKGCNHGFKYGGYMHLRGFSIKEMFQEGWRLTKENIVFLICFQIILFVLTALFSGAQEGFPTAQEDFKWSWMPWHLLGWIVIIVIKVGLYNSTLLITKGIKPGFEQLYSNWPRFISWVVSSFLVALMITVGLILFIVPGLYLWGKYGLFPFFILDKGYGPIEALKAAGKASEGIRWKLLLFFLACVGLDLLGALFFLIGLFITVPVTLLAMASVYRKLTAANDASI